jgi:hypothetical protein
MERPSRRQLLYGGGAAGGVAAAGALGWLDFLPFLGPEPAEQPDIGPVPADANLLIQADGEALRNDEGLRSVVSAGIDARTGDGQGPGDVAGLFAATAEGWGLDPSAITRATIFARIERETLGESMVGAVVEADWDPDGIAAAIDATAYSTTDREIAGVTVHGVDGTGTEIAALGDGRFALGVTGAVEGVLAITEAEVERVSGDLLSALGQAPESQVRFAAAMSPLTDGLATLLPFDDELIRDQLLSDLQYLHGTVYADGDRRGIDVSVRAGDDRAAEDFALQVKATRSIFAQQAPETAALPDAVNSITVEQDGDQVDVSFSGSVGRLTDLAPPVVEWLLGTGGVVVPTEAES